MTAKAAARLVRVGDSMENPITGMGLSGAMKIAGPRRTLGR
jgi:hypothetical protein